ncbi:hypothetical protein GFS24_02875 [Chitinophaga sp. SYP-B3965]|uniref:hypothetical protein n=1 Tax=Chitinophaga sp. SYP-B3965 TaxID=2663120 RepID=UPI001299CEE9|nr:hypothetical protein [Chitinophaga sp. SYP-B3965]MRG44038.1 hypothetical protein [Chitinophaga sp. SYP-B3965]
MRMFFFLVFLLSGFTSFGQGLFSRLQGISNRGTDFFNADGIEISSQPLKTDLSEKSILKKYKLKTLDTDSLLPLPNFHTVVSAEIVPGTTQITSYYFVGNTAITFGAINKQDRAFEREFVKLILDNAIPKSVYTPVEIDSINFAGRKIPLGRSCYWMGINNVQCPSYGQLNWSVHETLEDAAQSVTNQYNVIKAKKGGKIVSEGSVDVTFEGVDVKAQKAVYDFKGVTGLLAGMSGGKTLTVYLVSAPVRGNYVSCVMSFWNNDVINPGGLPPLLEKVMKLK